MSPIDPKPNRDEEDASRAAASLSVNILSRVIAILVLAALPVIAGYGLDNWLSTKWMVFVGCILAAMVFFVGIFSVSRQANQSLESIRKKRHT